MGEAGRRRYRSGDEKALFLFSRGRCYEPICREPVLRRIEDEMLVHVHKAHICGREPTAARYDPNIGDDLDRFNNLILLCKEHHDIVDRRENEKRYPVELLREWKRSREGDLSGQLSRLDFLTEEKLQQMLVEAITDTRETLEDAIGQIGGETADLLRQLLAESFDRPYLDSDDISLLAYSARMLVGLEDNAVMLHTAARMLQGLEDNVLMLRDAARRLEETGLHDVALKLSDVTSAARELSSVSASLHENDAVASMATNLSEIGEVADRLDGHPI